MQTLTLENKTRVQFKRDKGHSYLDIVIVCKGSTEKDIIDFVYDSGAYLIENPNPEPYISPDGTFTLACDGVFLLENLGK